MLPGERVLDLQQPVDLLLDRFGPARKPNLVGGAAFAPHGNRGPVVGSQLVLDGCPASAVALQLEGPLDGSEQVAGQH
jgi:hypothetical protein